MALQSQHLTVRQLTSAEQGAVIVLHSLWRRGPGVRSKALAARVQLLSHTCVSWTIANNVAVLAVAASALQTVVNTINH